MAKIVRVYPADQVGLGMRVHIIEDPSENHIVHICPLIRHTTEDGKYEGNIRPRPHHDPPESMNKMFALVLVPTGVRLMVRRAASYHMLSVDGTVPPFRSKACLVVPFVDEVLGVLRLVMNNYNSPIAHGMECCLNTQVLWRLNVTFPTPNVSLSSERSVVFLPRYLMRVWRVARKDAVIDVPA